MSKKEELLGTIVMVTIVLSCFLISVLLAEAVGKEGYLGLETSRILFPTLIQVNTTLIGFWGIVFVYVLKSFDEHRRYLVESADDIITKLEKLTLEKNDFSDYEKLIIDSWFEGVEKYHDSVENLGNDLRKFIGFGIFVTAAFVSSILSCILSVGIIEEAGVATKWLTFSLLPFMLGVAFTFFGIWLTSPEVPKKREKPYLPKKLNAVD